MFQTIHITLYTQQKPQKPCCKYCALRREFRVLYNFDEWEIYALLPVLNDSVL